MMMMNMTSMAKSMVFTTDHSTPLYSSAWTPNSTGAYAGTCIFLALLAVLSRLLLAYRHLLEVRWHDKAIQRRYIVLAGDSAQASKALGTSGVEKREEATLTTHGVDERVRVIRSSRRGIETKPWRLSTDVPRSCLYTIQAGVGYLL